MTQVIFHSISPEEFKELVLEAIRETLIDSSLETKKSGSTKSEDSNKNEFLTRKQTADLLQISLPTLHQYTKSSFISSYRIGNKVRYRKRDIESALTERNFKRRN